jgi:dihydroflavonol-4-reductase
MRVFVTGGTGFVGTRLATVLARRGHELRCLARTTSDTRHLRRLGATICVGDVDNRDALREAMTGCDALVHLANVYSMWERDRSVFQRVNVAGTRNVMVAALEAGVPKVVHISTDEVFGTPRGVLSERSPIARSHTSEYGRTKAAGERVAWGLHHRHGLPLIVLNPAGILGGGDPKPQGHYLRLLAERRFPARFAESHVMTWVYVGDVAEAIARVLEKPGNVGERYLIGRESLTYGELTRLACEAAGVSPPLLALPDAACFAVAWLLSAVADVTRRPPLWGISLDEARTALRDIHYDARKSERELGLVYTPLRVAIEEEVAFLRKAPRAAPGLSRPA